MNTLLSMLQGPTGKGSASRALTAVVVVAVVGVWAVISIRKNEMQTLTTEQVGIVVGALGIQVAHKAQEKKNANHSGGSQVP